MFNVRIAKSKTDFEAILKCYYANFATDEPTLEYCGVGPDEELYITTYLLHYMKDGLSVMCQDDNGKIVGFIIGYSFKRDEEYEEPEGIEKLETSISRKLSNVLRIDQEILPYQMVFEKLSGYKKRALFIEALCTDRNYRGRGIASKMFARVLQHAKGKGCDCACMQVTTLATRKIALKFDMIKLRELKWREMNEFNDFEPEFELYQSYVLPL